MKNNILSGQTTNFTKDSVECFKEARFGMIKVTFKGSSAVKNTTKTRRYYWFKIGDFAPPGACWPKILGRSGHPHQPFFFSQN